MFRKMLVVLVVAFVSDAYLRILTLAWVMSGFYVMQRCLLGVRWGRERGRAVLENPNFSLFLFRTAPKHHQPPTANHQPPNKKIVLFLWSCVLSMS